MDKTFRCIALIGLPRHHSALSTHKMLYQWLTKQGYSVLIEKAIAKALHLESTVGATLDEIGQLADLAIVIGGDGNMLGAARILSQYEIKVIGINRGRLGFLTDLIPADALPQLKKVLAGEYYSEKRFLLEAQVLRADECVLSHLAMNELVLHSGKVAHMIDFEVYINHRLAFAQRSDGLIISTPTGSTAYSLSAGGPILTPNLDAIVLVPMFPHTLSARPLVISSDSIIILRIINYRTPLVISCDSQITLPLKRHDEVLIKRSACQLDLIHPLDYNYFNTLTSKLDWSKKLT